MPKYLFLASYTPEGAQGLRTEGGSARRAQVETLFRQNGGQLEGFYFALGENDAYIFGELPDNETVAAIQLAVAADGKIDSRTVALLTPEELDAAAKRSVDYRPPGS